MEEEHLTCPKCSYDLYGIPQARCPECGFGFDHAALREMGATAERVRLAAAQFVILRAMVCTALAAMPLIENLGIGGVSRLLLGVIVYSGAFFAYVWFAGYYRGSTSLPIIATAYVGLGVLVTRFRTPLVWIAPLAATFVLLWAWRDRLLHWGTLYRPRYAEANATYRTVDRHSTVATGILLLASFLLLVHRVI